MNPGKLNHRIRFFKEVSALNSSGGAVLTETPLVCSQTAPTDVTWGDLQPIKQYHQWAIEAGATVLNGDKTLVIRYRSMFTPQKGYLFEDLNNPGDIYTVHAISPYYPGTKSSFQNTEATVYKDQVFVFILGIKRS